MIWIFYFFLSLIILVASAFATFILIIFFEIIFLKIKKIAKNEKI